MCGHWLGIFNMSHIFISYSRRDKELAEKISRALADKKLDTWIDLKSIPKSVDWEREIRRGIEEADAFLFLISPDSVQSESCISEIEHAVKNSKRIIPIVIRDTDSKTIPQTILKLNWTFCREEQDDFDTAMKDVEKAIHTDYDWLRFHTDLQERALKWDERKDASRLMRGKDLKEVEQHLANVEVQNNPELTSLQRQYILASRRGEEKLRQVITWGLSIMLIIMIVLLFVALDQRIEALDQRKIALARTDELKYKANIADANKLLDEHNPDLALALAMYVTKAGDPPGEAYPTLLDAAYLSLSPNVFPLCNKEGAINPWATSVDISFDNQTAAVGCSYDNESKIVLINLKTGEIINSWTYNSRIFSLSFSPDGQSILAGYKDSFAILWGLDGSILFSLVEHSNAVSAVAFSPDGTKAVTASYDKSVVLWDIRSNSIIDKMDDSTTPYYLGKITSVAYNSSGTHVVFGDDEGNVIVWNLGPGTIYLNRIEKDRHTDFVLSVAFSPDNRQVVSSSADSTVKIWDIDFTIDQLILYKTLNGQDNKWINSIRFLPDGKKILSASANGSVLLWDIATQQIIQRLDGHLGEVNSLAISSDGALAVSGSRDGSIRLWDLQALQVLDSVIDNRYLPAEITSMVFTVDYSRLISGSSDGRIRIWDLGNKKLLESWKIYPAQIPIPSIAISPDGRQLLTGASNGEVVLWDIATQKEIRRFNKYMSSIRSTDFSPDGNTVLLGYANGSIVVWNAQTGREQCELIGHTNAVNAVRFSSDGINAVSGSNDHTVLWWDISKCQEVSEIIRQESWVMAIDISPDGKLIASASADQSIVIWNKEHNQQIHMQLPPADINQGLNPFALSIAFSPDGSLLSSGYANGSIAIWSVADGRLLRKFISPAEANCELGIHCFWVWDVKFSKQGDLVYSGSADGALRTWPIIKAQNIAELRSWVEQNRYLHSFSDTERSLYDLVK